RDLRGAAALHRAIPLRRRPCHRGGVGGGRARPLLRAARAAAGPERPGGDRAGPPRRHRRRLDLRRQRSPVYKLAKDYRVALPLHPEFRTMPMVWYIPPLSPVVERLTETGHDGEDAANLFGAIDALRIPVEYLAELFTAGDPEPVRGVLQKLAAMRSYMRDVTLDRPRDESVATAVGMTGKEIVEMYRLLAIAKYDERYVIPTAYEGEAHQLEE